MPAEASRFTVTFLCHIHNVGNDKGNESCRQQGAKRATARAARAIAKVMRVVGDEEGEGQCDGDGNKGGGLVMVTVTVTKMAKNRWQASYGKGDGNNGVEQQRG